MINITNIDYGKCCTEILAIINNMSIENSKKIPKELIDAFEANKDNNYDFNLDYSKDLKNQELSPFTIAILNNLYRDYWASEDTRNKIILEEHQKRYEQEKMKREMYNPDNLFKKKNNTECVAMVEYKENVFKKIINKLKKIFKGLKL